MFRRALRYIFNVRHNYHDPVSQQRARVLIVINAISVILVVVWLLITLLITPFLNSEVAARLPIVELLFIPLISAIIYIGVQRGYLFTASTAYVVFQFVIPIVIVSNGISSASAVFVLLPLMSAVLLLPRRGVIASGVVLIILTATGYYIQLQLDVGTNQRALLDLALISIAIIVSTALLTVVSTITYNNTLASFVTARHYENIARLSSEIQAPTLNEDDAIRHALTRAIETMGVAYAQMFITDAGGSIKRRVRTAFGQNLTTRVDEEAALGDTNIVYQAARNRITMTTSMQSPEMRRRHFLASTRASAAVPVMLNGELLGVLDFQIETANDFTEMQLKTFEMLADVVAAAIESQRGRRAMQAALKQAQEANQERGSQAYSQRSVDQAYWNTLFQPEGESAIGFDLDTMRKAFVEAKDLAPSLRQTLSKGKTHVDARPEGSVVSVPIMIGQQVLGAMSFQLPVGRTLSKRQTELVETIAERLALALENRRLFEQSRTQAERERKANDIARVLLAATEVDMVLRIAADNFNNALGAINTEIHVQAAPQTSVEQSEETVS